MSSENITETPDVRFVGDQPFTKHKPSGKPTDQAGVALAKQVDAENERAALLTNHPGAVESFNAREAREQQQKDDLSMFVDLDWEEKTTPDGQKKMLCTTKNFFFCARNFADGAAPRDGVREDFLLRVCYEPWIETQDLSQAERFRKTGALGKPVKERFPLALMTLSLFIQKFRPVNDCDISPLQELCKVDEGHEDVPPPMPPKLPTLADLITALTDTLKK
jgi:hypothetical protein